MLASRGAVYSSERSATRALDGRKYHNSCRCKARAVLNRRFRGEVEVDPADAKRTIRGKVQNGYSYEYDLEKFNVVPPLPDWG